MTARLEQLASRATVRIGPYDAPDELWGSGFFVAPGWVLTCAHVLPPGQDAESVGELRVRGHQLDAPARLAYRLGGGTDPDQDLALVRLPDPPPPHACVRLTDHYDPPHRVTALGWRTPKGGQPQSWSGHSECNGRDGPYGLTLAPHMEIPHGASGGPLLDRDRGVVAGIVKARRANKDGGLAVAVTALRGFRAARPVGDEDTLGADPYAALIRAHDLWHRRAVGGMSWVRTQSDTCRGAERAWGPRDSAEASALLAALPRPDSPAVLQRTIALVLGYEPLWEDELAPLDWRDGQGWVHDEPDGADIIALHYLLAVAHMCRDRSPDAVAALEHWVKARVQALPDYLGALLRSRTEDTDALGAACRADDDQGPVVAVELEPDPYRPGDRFHWRVWTWPDGPETARVLEEDAADEGVPLTELPEALDEPLGRAFRRFDAQGRLTRLELALPVEHFGTHVHTWPLGARREVVLRCLKRRGEPAAVWRDRWGALAVSDLKPLPVQPDYAQEALATAPPGAVPVLCRPPRQSEGPLTEAIGAGYGVALWSLKNEHARACGTDCGELYGTAARLLDSARATAVPERLRLLREKNDETDWTHHIALLYDDPRRPIPLRDDVLDAP
ncbi:trypsin-like peptidase domain-containing protein [Streptomyces sp. YU58]|uniref:VMAP-C domain-containing protein n=1 Tax=Streptomyces sp. SX92 TaxID=3158972 RepID=UPI0027BAE7B4|nr:trypsin-like peptidase domain-containing protein [Streptomyces coralus]WLW52257.1 trypsin-like peptidase domain-containing protein [Streptomyces coralus]